MPTGIFVSVSDYLASSYDPDCDYVDGHLEKRNGGEWDHASLQMRISAYLYARQDQWGIRVVPELRMRVDPTRQAYAATAQLGLREIKDVLPTENPAIEVPLIEIFRQKKKSRPGGWPAA